MAYTTPVDILNTALQLLGQGRVTTFTSTTSKSARECAFAYDKLRLEELSNNLWRFSTKRAILRAISIDTQLWTPPTWAAGTYAAGAIVSYTPTTGPYEDETIVWQTRSAKTGADTATPDNDSDYAKFNGLLTVDLYNTGNDGASTTSYMAGEIVLAPSVWLIGTTYAINAVVRGSSGGTVWYVSLQAGNLGNAVTDTTWWAEWTGPGRSNGTYGVTAETSPIPLTFPGTVGVYVSRYNNNEDNPTSGTVNWLNCLGTVEELNVLYPLGAGPLHDLRTANVYHLPNGFLKRAPTDPKAGLTSYLGSHSGSAPEDWLEEDQYIVSNDAGPLMMRFVADVTDVARMDPLFCGALAARLAQQENEIVTENTGKSNRLDRAYILAIRRARRSNAIEIGPISQTENRYVTVRA